MAFMEWSDEYSVNVTDIAARARQGVAVLNVELATFLKDWLNNHISFNDHGLT